MSRRAFADCCHYDDGYDDGFDDGKDERGPNASVAVEVLRLVARERLIGGDVSGADLAAAMADEIERHSDSFDRRLQRERERQAEIVQLYAEARQPVTA